MTERFPVERLTCFVKDVFVAQDVLPDHAAVTADRLVEADLRGRTGHGIIRVPLYSERIKAGSVNLRPDIRPIRESPVSALVEGDNGMGQAIMTYATELAIAKAAESGLAWVGTVHSNHAGAAGVYTALALRAGMIAMYFAVGNANSMPPWGGVERLLGTNPIAIAIPAGEEDDFQLDISTSVASHGTIKVYAQEGKLLPEGWVTDLDGNPVTDPKEAADGFLLPIGGYKGAGLNIAIGLLAGVLNGAAFGSEVVDHRVEPNAPTNSGQAIFVMRPDLFQDPDDYRTAVDAHVRELRTSQTQPGAEIRMPGAHAAALEEELRADGVPVPDALLGQLRALAAELSLNDRLY